jgi:hypothetical protein
MSSSLPFFELGERFSFFSLNGDEKVRFLGGGQGLKESIFHRILPRKWEIIRSHIFIIRLCAFCDVNIFDNNSFLEG